MPEKPYKRTCSKCGVEFLAQSPHYRYCGKCRSFYTKGNDYPKLYYKNRKIAFDRDEMMCQCCGCKEDGLHTNSLLVHHIDTDRGNNSLSNLITMCQQCHLSLHQKYSKYILRRSNIYKLFAQEKQYGEFGKTIIYESAKKIVKKQFTGKPVTFFKTKLLI